MLFRKKVDTAAELADAFEAVEIIRHAKDVESTYLLTGYAFGVVSEKMHAKRIARKTGRTIMRLAEAVAKKRCKEIEKEDPDTKRETPAFTDISRECREEDDMK